MVHELQHKITLKFGRAEVNIRDQLHIFNLISDKLEEDIYEF